MRIQTSLDFGRAANDELIPDPFFAELKREWALLAMAYNEDNILLAHDQRMDFEETDESVSLRIKDYASSGKDFYIQCSHQGSKLSLTGRFVMESGAMWSYGHPFQGIELAQIKSFSRGVIRTAAADSWYPMEKEIADLEHQTRSIEREVFNRPSSLVR